MSSDRQTAFQIRKEIITENLTMYLKELAALEALGEIGDGAGSIYLSTYRKEIDISPIDGKSAREVALNVLSALKAAGHPPSVARKTFDKESGKVTFSIPGPMAGWTIEVRGGEPRCKIKRVVAQKEVPVYEKVQVGTTREEMVTFEIENPEECGAEVSE